MTKVIFLSVESAREPFFEDLLAKYKKKISFFTAFQNTFIKKPNVEDSQRAAAESRRLLDFLNPEDYVILCDESGKSLNSKAFSHQLQQIVESGKSRIVFIVGGAFGVDESVRKRAQLLISLSPFTLNHLVAQAVILEQIYRAFTIWKGFPYHK